MRASVLLLGGLLALLAAPALGADDLTVLLRDYEARLAKRDEAGYAAQRELLERIADLRSPEARRALAGLLERYGPMDRRGAALILAAQVRRGSPKDLDGVISWIEERHDPLLLDLLPRVVAAAQETATQEHARGAALQRAVPPIKAQIARGLGERRDREAVLTLLLLLKEADLTVKAEALEALGKIGDSRALGTVALHLRDVDPRVRDAAARSLGFLGDPAAVPFLVRVVEGEKTPLVLESAAAALSRLDRPEGIPPLIERFGATLGKDLRLEDALLRALTTLSGKDLGSDVDAWRAWWETVKGRPFQKSVPDPAGKTVQGIRYYDFPLRSSRVLFVIDVSRSMGWNGRIAAAKTELIRVLEALPPTTRFNVVVYSDEARAWAPKLTEAKPSVVKRAVDFVERLQPENGTNTDAALRVALTDPDADTVFLLSDGHPSVGEIVDPDLILAQVRNLNRWRRVRIHAVALLIGDPPALFAGRESAELAVDFMSRLAAENDGLFKRVP